MCYTVGVFVGPTPVSQGENAKVVFVSREMVRSGSDESFSRRVPIVVVAEYILDILGRQFANRVAGARPRVALPRAGIPPHCTEQADKARNADRVVHVRGRDGVDGGEEQHHADENHPCDGHGVDGLAPAAHGVWACVEDDSIFVPSMCDDDSDVGDVECGRGDVEDGGYG